MKCTAVACALAFMVATSATTLTQDGRATDAPRGGSQKGATTTPPTRQSPSATMTLVGCIQSASDVAAGNSTPPGPGAPDIVAQLLLTNAHVAEPPPVKAPDAVSAAAGTTAPPPAVGTTGRTGSTYIIEGSGDIRDHLGQQVEVTATMAPGLNPEARTGGARPATAGRAADSSPDIQGQDTPPPAANVNRGTAAGPSPATAATQRLRVSSIRMLAPSCAQ